MNTSAISRRRFAQLLGLGAAASAVRPPLSFARAPLSTATANRIVRLSSNENPYGPSRKALQAITDAFDLAWRYPDAQVDALIAAIARANTVAPEQILLGAGSSEILKLAAAAFTGRSRDDSKSTGGALVVADPTFEAILKYSAVEGAEIVKVPLTDSFSHDLPKMAAAAKSGLVYVCNPNNPTASITPKGELRDFVTNAPRDTMILVDEAYHHYVESADYESVVPLVKDHPNLLVARTFSKIYGMAGLRCGYAIAQKDAIERMRAHQAFDSVSCTTVAAANASLADADQVTTGRRRNSEVRAFLARELEAIGYNHIPSHANFIMIDVRRPVVPLIAAMKERKVEVGRLFPSLPNHLRLTIGMKTEMDAFLAAFRAETA